MEYKTVLKNPETVIEIDSNVKSVNVEIKKKDLRRFCSHVKMQNIVTGGLAIFTMISLVAQLPLHMQSQNQQKQLELIKEKIKDLLIAYEIQMQMIKGSDYDFALKADRPGSRRERTVSTHIAHFYLYGHEREGRATENGIFMWKNPSYRSFSREDDFSVAGGNNADDSFTKVRIHKTGVYYVFAKVTANGRSNISYRDAPPVGIVLKRQGGGADRELDQSWVTQDDRGQEYGPDTHTSQEDKYPMDTIEISGLYRLQVNDKIYIQLPSERTNNRDDRFLGEGLKARFGAFLIESSFTG